MTDVRRQERLVLVACSSAEPTSDGIDASSPDDAVSETTNIDANIADTHVADTNIATDSFVTDTAKKETSSDVAVEAAPVCGDLAQLAPVVTTEYTLDPHLVYTGGTIEDGTCILKWRDAVVEGHLPDHRHRGRSL